MSAEKQKQTNKSQGGVGREMQREGRGGRAGAGGDERMHMCIHTHVQAFKLPIASICTLTLGRQKKKATANDLEVQDQSLKDGQSI